MLAHKQIAITSFITFGLFVAAMAPLTPAAYATAAADADFAARCNAAGVLRCEGWDNASDFTPASGDGGYASGLYAAEDGTYQGVQDTTTMTSGAGSLKFIIRPGTVHPLGSNPSGLWKANFGPDNSITSFGPHTTLYFQFRLRLDPNMLNFNWTTVSGQGWKVFIAFGPTPGDSCTGDQFVQENTNQTNVFTGYTSCGSPALDTNNGVTPYLLEQGDYNCPYSSDSPYTSNPNCFAYPSNTWITEYWIVKTGDFGQPNTSFTAYAGVQGQPLKKWIDLPNFTFNTNPDPGDALMQLILQPYFSGATNATTNPASAMWFDELIISSQPIATPLDNSGGATPPPPPPTTSACDVNGDGQVNVADVQKEVLMALQLSPCTNPDSQCTIIQVEDVVNAVLGGTCVAP